MPYLDNIVIMLQQASYSMEISSTKKNVTMVVHNKVEWLYNISFLFRFISQRWNKLDYGQA